MEKITREPQYQPCLDLAEKQGLHTFGLMSNYTWEKDPKRLLFLLSRYKFVAKMFEGMNRVLEVGCADAFGTRIVRQSVSNVTAVDFDPVFIEDVRKRETESDSFECIEHNILSAPVRGDFDGAYSLDVIEHIRTEEESCFIKNMAASLQPAGALIVGTPSLSSQRIASPASKEGHINCKTANQLNDLLKRYFDNVFLFSMNDEVIHTGNHEMAHYLMALCCRKKQSGN